MSCLSNKVALALSAGGGYKSGTMYSVLPTDGSGDFTSARAGTKVVTNEDGYLETIAIDVPPVSYVDGVPVINVEGQATQLLTRPISFDHADWTKSGATVTGGFPAPAVDENGDVLLDAFKLVATENDGYIRLTTPLTITATQDYSNSIFIKRVTGTGAVSLININTGDVVKTITTDWQRFETTALSAGTSGQIGVKLATAGDEVMIYYGQAEAGAAGIAATTPVYIDKTLEGAQQTRNADVITTTYSGLNFGTGDFTMQFSIIPKDLGLINGIYSTDSFNTLTGIAIYIASSYDLRVATSVPLVFVGFFNDTDINTNVLITVVKSGLSIKTYKNRVYFGEQTLPAGFNLTNSSKYIGSRSGVYGLNGGIKSALFFNKALTAQEIELTP